MNDKDFESIQNIFRTVLNISDLVIHEKLSAADIANWDSMNHINLIITIEEVFKVRFSNLEVSHLENVGQLLSLLESKTLLN